MTMNVIMTRGKHIERHECERMHELYEKGYWAGLIGHEFGISESGVRYHLDGRCSHEQNVR